jgi:hypothetical protein
MEYQEAIHEENLLQVLAAHNLQAKSTFFNHSTEEYVTYTSIPTNHHLTGVPSMHDVVACSQSLHKQIHNCQTALHGVASDHKAVRLKLTLSSIKFKTQAISRGTIDWPKIMLDDHTQMFTMNTSPC